METWKSKLEAIPIGLYEKALPATLDWEQRLTIAQQAGFDFLEISIDETEHRLARLDWGKAERRGDSICSESCRGGNQIIELERSPEVPAGEQICQHPSNRSRYV